MRALKKARKLIENKSGKPAADTLSRLVLALESEVPFLLSDLYSLDYDDFNLAMEGMAEWRLDRYYTSKAVLLDLSMQETLQKAQPGAEAPKAAVAKADGPAASTAPSGACPTPPAPHPPAGVFFRPTHRDGVLKGATSRW